MTNSPNVTSYHPDLIVEEAKNGWRIIRLNRPKSLHALDESIVVALLQVFEEFHTIWILNPGCLDDIINICEVCWICHSHEENASPY